ncbi:MAG: NAD(P)/FAD-dependent oxidoreductase [Alphaproteobacteria bacterium]|nr:NAD(P)/FAD-dependent oxidoreductase [Alphaproteobacteria bacterium]
MPSPDRVQDPTRFTRRRVRTEIPESVDVAIIGAGLGGLSAAAHLARSGLKVALFDGHYVAGGCATMFSRGRDEHRYHFDVGVHYIGDCGPEGFVPRLLRGVGVDVDFVPLDPDGFDTVVLPGLEFRIPSDRALYHQRLHEAFPGEKRGIDRYVRMLEEVDFMQTQTGVKQRKGLQLAWDVVTGARLMARYMQQPLSSFLDSCTQDPLLRGVMLGQSGDYGVPPSRASVLMHAGLANHYFRGAWYPKGGGQVIADQLSEVVEAHEGVIVLRQPIERILVEGGRAVGVRTQGGRRESQDVKARVVLSNADLKRTLLELLPPEHLPDKLRSKAEGWEMAGAIFLTCLGVKRDMAAAGMRNANYWCFDLTDAERVYAEAAEGFTPEVAYITSATLKDATPGHAPEGIEVVECMTLAAGDPRKWGVKPGNVDGGGYRQERGYAEMKQRVEEAMVNRLERLFPGTADAVVFKESASPVTHMRYTRASEGTGYGLAATPGQFLFNRPGYRGPVPGLYFCGASTRAGHGIMGALASGRDAAHCIAKDLDLNLEVA